MAWTAPKTWAAETLTSADLNLHLRDNELYLKAHADATLAMHGLPANVAALGNRAAAGQFIQIAAATGSNAGAEGDSELTASWPVAFSTLLIAIPVLLLVSGTMRNQQPWGWTTGVTGVHCHFHWYNGDGYALYAIGIGT